MRRLLFFLCMFCITLSAEVKHPHLLFSGEDLPLLREKIRTGVPQRAFSRLEVRCKRHLALKKAPDKVVRGTPSDLTPDPLSELALAWLLTEKQEYLDALNRLVSDAESRKIDLNRTGCCVPFIFDWGYQGLSGKSRKYLKDLILKELNQNPKMNRYPAHGIHGNWGYFMYMPWSIRYHAVLAGHPEFKKNSLDRAAEAMKISLTHAITKEGMSTEHGAYANYPFLINGSAILMLERKGYPMVKTSNLPQLGHWLLLETTAGDNPMFFPMRDCNEQPPAIYMLRLLARLMPDDPAIQNLLARSHAEEEPSPDPLSGIIFHTAPGKTVLPSNMKKEQFYPSMNLMLYRSDWSDKPLQFAAEAIVERGHSHSDAGSFLLYADGARRVFDPGYGIKDGTSHSIMTISGKAPSSHGGACQVDGQLFSNFAQLLTEDMFDVWNTAEVYSLRRKATPSVEYAERTFALISPDKTSAIPGYLVIADHIRSLNAKEKYEFRLQLDAFQKAGFHEKTVLIENPVSDAKQINDEKIAVTLSKAGMYHAYLLLSGKSGVTLEQNGRKLGSAWCSTTQGRFHWFCLAKNLKLEAGKNSFELKAPDGVKAVTFVLSVMDQKKIEEDFSGECCFSFARKAPRTELWIPEPEDLQFTSNFVRASKDFQNHRTVIASASQGDFLTILLPYGKEDVPPEKRSFEKPWYGFNAALNWNNAVDLIALGINRETPTAPLATRLSILRISRQDFASFPSKFPKDVRWCVADGGIFQVNGFTLFEAKEKYGDRQMIAYPRVAIHGWAVYDGESVKTEFRLERRSGAFIRPVSVKAYAPHVKEVFCNGKKVSFRQQGDHVVFDVLPLPCREAGAAQKEELQNFSSTFHKG